MKARGRSFSLVAAASVLALGTLSACDEDTIVGLPEGAVEVRLAFDGYPQDTMRIAISDTAAIRLAREFVNTGQGPKLPIGRIVRGAGLDPRYPFHFEPASVQFADFAIEVCDGAPMRTDSAVVEFMKGATGLANPTSATWCPWGAYPVEVKH
jgi:hypothetical protein